MIGQGQSCTVANQAMARINGTMIAYFDTLSIVKDKNNM